MRVYELIRFLEDYEPDFEVHVDIDEYPVVTGVYQDIMDEDRGGVLLKISYRDGVKTNG